MNGVRRKKTPSAMITTPAIFSSVARSWLRVSPRPVAVMPSATKIVVNERQKTIAGSRIFSRLRSPLRISAIETPETADR